MYKSDTVRFVVAQSVAFRGASTLIPTASFPFALPPAVSVTLPLHPYQHLLPFVLSALIILTEVVLIYSSMMAEDIDIINIILVSLVCLCLTF